MEAVSLGLSLTPHGRLVLTPDTEAPQAPAIAAFPAFTAGSERTISWDGFGASAFEAQAASDAEFTHVIAASGWIAASTHTFTGLADGQTYDYRVRGRDAAGNESVWSVVAASTQDASAPETADATTAT